MLLIFEHKYKCTHTFTRYTRRPSHHIHYYIHYSSTHTLTFFYDSARLLSFFTFIVSTNLSIKSFKIPKDKRHQSAVFTCSNRMVPIGVQSNNNKNTMRYPFIPLNHITHGFPLTQFVFHCDINIFHHE